MELRFPIAIIQADNLGLLSASMNELVIADINANVGNPFTVSVMEEYQITRLRLAHSFRLSVLSQRITGNRFAGFLVNVLNETTAVKSTCRRSTEPVRNASQSSCTFHDIICQSNVITALCN